MHFIYILFALLHITKPLTTRNLSHMDQSITVDRRKALSFFLPVDEVCRGVILGTMLRNILREFVPSSIFNSSDRLLNFNWLAGHGHVSQPKTFEFKF